jgi:hypothetical protein
MTSEQLRTRARIGYAAQTKGFTHSDTVVDDQHTEIVVNRYVHFDPARLSVASGVGESFPQHRGGFELDR